MIDEYCLLGYAMEIRENLKRQKMSNRRKNTMVLCSISILIIMYVLMGCKQQPEVKVKSQFSTSDLLADYDYLWETLEAEYLFFPVL